MVTFTVGMPGDGKTLYSVRQLLEDLIETEVFIVTNIALNISNVVAYVSKRRAEIEQKRGLDLPPFDIDARLKVIPDAEVYEFFRHRSGGLVLEWSPDKGVGDDGQKRVTKEAFNAAMKKEFLRMTESPAYQLPVHYYIDEAHDFFDSREWSACGRGILFYASKHRHLHDNIYLITQVMENVEGRLRKLASETQRVRNFLRRRVGPVRMRPIFKIGTFYGTDTNKKPFMSKDYPLDVDGVASCYKTVGALGVHSKAEANNNKAWLPWWVMIVFGVLIVLGIFGAIFGLPYLGSAYGKHMAHVTLADPVDKAKAAAPAGDTSTKTAVAAAAVPAPSPAPSTFIDQDRDKKPWATGYVLFRGRVTITMSDGSIRTEKDSELQAVERNYIILGGDKLYFRPAARETPRAAPTVLPSLPAVPSKGLDYPPPAADIKFGFR